MTIIIGMNRLINDITRLINRPVNAFVGQRAARWPQGAFLRRLPIGEWPDWAPMNGLVGQLPSIGVFRSTYSLNCLTPLIECIN